MIFSSLDFGFRILGKSLMILLVHDKMFLVLLRAHNCLKYSRSFLRIFRYKYLGTNYQLWL